MLMLADVVVDSRSVQRCLHKKSQVFVLVTSQKNLFSLFCAVVVITEKLSCARHLAFRFCCYVDRRKYFLVVMSSSLLMFLFFRVRPDSIHKLSFQLSTQFYLSTQWVRMMRAECVIIVRWLTYHLQLCRVDSSSSSKQKNT